MSDFIQQVGFIPIFEVTAAAPGITNHILAEDGSTLAAEDGSQLTQE